jgi:integrating conjugative element protein (TIGR03761 family)
MEQSTYSSEKDIMFLHTKAAIQHFHGSWKTNKVSLVQLARTLLHLCTAIKASDPYAEYILHQTYEKMQSVMKYFDEAELVIKSEIDSIRGISVKIYTNRHPFKAALNFATPYAYIGARLLFKLDMLLRLLLTLKKMGIREHEAYYYSRFLKEIHQIYTLPRSWQSTGITRQDLVDNTATAQKALFLMGALPQSIIEEPPVLPFGPYRRHSKVPLPMQENNGINGHSLCS